jgi:hypothetical protein
MPHEERPTVTGIDPIAKGNEFPQPALGQQVLEEPLHGPMFARILIVADR